jgi:hypothetical protein
MQLPSAIAEHPVRGFRSSLGEPLGMIVSHIRKI